MARKFFAEDGYSKLPRMGCTHVEAMSERRLLDATRRLVALSFTDGYPTIHNTAARLGMRVRSLQRRLGSAGLAYSAIVDQARRDAARALLERPQPRIAEIARRLGYRDPSSFSRAFLRWTGESPRAYRQRCLRRRKSPTATRDDGHNSWQSSRNGN